MRPRLLLTINCKFAVDFFARGLHTRTAVARLPLRQLGFLVQLSMHTPVQWAIKCSQLGLIDEDLLACTWKGHLGRLYYIIQ